MPQKDRIAGRVCREMGREITGGTEEQRRQERQSIPGGTGQSMRGCKHS